MTYASGGASITGGPLQVGQTITVYGTLLNASGGVTTNCPDRITNATSIVVGGATPGPTSGPVAPPTGSAHVGTVVGHATLGAVSGSAAAAAINYIFAPSQSDSDQWRASGVKTIAYVDAAFQNGPPDYAPWRTSDESTYLHTCGGSRATLAYSGLTSYFMDMGSSSYQSLVHSTIAAQASHFDAFMMDEALGSAMEYSSSINPPCSTWVNFNYNDPATAASAKLASLLSNAFGGQSTFLNGLGLAPDDGTPYAAMQNTLNDANVVGGVYEYCFLGQTDHQVANKRTDTGWQSVLASYVDTTRRGRAFWCLAYGSGDGNTDTGRDQRLYAYASFLLGYDGRSLLQETFSESHGMPVYPETKLVPSSPIDAAGANPRRFSSCSIGGTSIGACAVFVNSSSTRTASVPSGYGASLRLVGGSVFEGGSLAGSAVPSSIGPAEAVILLPSGVLPS